MPASRISRNRVSFEEINATWQPARRAKVVSAKATPPPHPQTVVGASLPFVWCTRKHPYATFQFAQAVTYRKEKAAHCNGEYREFSGTGMSCFSCSLVCLASTPVVPGASYAKIFFGY